MKRTLLCLLSFAACSILDAQPAVEYEVVTGTLWADPCDAEYDCETSGVPLEGSFKLAVIRQLPAEHVYGIDDLVLRSVEGPELDLRGGGRGSYWVVSTPRGIKGDLSLLVEIDGAAVYFRPPFESQRADEFPSISVFLWGAELGTCYCLSLTAVPRPGTGPFFTRGDANGNAAVEIADAVAVLQRLFVEGSALTCEDAADADDDGELAIADAVLVLEYLFRRGHPPRGPFLICGFDATEDELGCETGSPACAVEDPPAGR